MPEWVVQPEGIFVLITLGTVAVAYEVARPGFGAGAIVGAILMIIAAYGLMRLRTNPVGVALVVTGVVLLIAEIFIRRVGVLAAAGALALFIGGLTLFDGPTAVDLRVLAPSVLAVTITITVIAARVNDSRTRPAHVGADTLLGRSAEVRTMRGPDGQVFLDGAWWRVRAVDGLLKRGDRVRVVDRRGLTLIVEHEQEPT